MTFTLTLLLCLGLTLGLWIPGLTRTLPKPILRVQPDSVVSNHTNVTLLCEGARGAKQYHLYKLRSPDSWPIKILLEPGNKVEFSISKVEPHHAGVYCCYYYIQDGWSEGSETQELVVAGVYSKPRLSVQPSPVVTPGENVTLQCVSKQKYDRFILIKEGPQKLSWMLDSQYNHLTQQFQALFSVGPVTISQRWTFRCYSYYRSEPQVWSKPSEPLDLLFSGTLQKPTIKSESGSIIASGSPNTIWCQGTLDVELYVLHKEGNQKPWNMKTPEESSNEAKFSIPSVTQQHGGQYRCYCYSSAGWLERSDSLELVVTGIHYYKPSLSVLPSPVVTSGRNMTLQCVSWVRYEKFILTKENEKFTSSLNAQYIYPTRNYQVLFSMENMTPDHAGTFRCYGYYKNTPYLWSVPSEPLEIHILGPIGTPSKPPLRPMSTANASMEDKQSEDDVELDSWRPAEEQPHGVIYAQVKPSRLRRAGAVLPSVMSKESLETKVGQVEEGREMDSQAAKNEGPQDVTYVQMCRRTLKLGKASSHHFQAGENPKESGVYATLAGTGPSPVFKNKE
uniref:leukocyte immunoglobulin-like receptor subfamily B member 3-like isoform X4 n=1 Tax=Myodes glareolus TaxID=447135 RepID=UPI0020221685|nr:leukocyte immunoglobulin-like receptor subfamily B member 3-like isoform X4 [Myodes glareolus]